MALVLQPGATLENGLAGIPRIDLTPDVEPASIIQSMRDYGAAVLRVVDAQDLETLQSLAPAARDFFSLPLAFRKKYATDPKHRVGDRWWAHSRNDLDSADYNRTVTDEEDIPFPGRGHTEIAPLAEKIRWWRHFGEHIVDLVVRGGNEHYGEERELDFRAATVGQFNLFDIPTKKEIKDAAAMTTRPKLREIFKELTPEAVAKLTKFQGVHGDRNFVTVGMQATRPGLRVQVKGHEDKYANVRLAPDEVIVYGGKLLELMTGGEIEELMHYVANMNSTVVPDGYDEFDRISGQVFTSLPAEGDPIMPWRLCDATRENPNAVREESATVVEYFGSHAGLVGVGAQRASRRRLTAAAARLRQYLTRRQPI